MAIIPPYISGYSRISIASKIRYPSPLNEANVSTKNKTAIDVPIDTLTAVRKS